MSTISRTPQSLPWKAARRGISTADSTWAKDGGARSRDRMMSRKDHVVRSGDRELGTVVGRIEQDCNALNVIMASV
jgi:hypothetical protein